jgi:hypothetical protein
MLHEMSTVGEDDGNPRNRVGWLWFLFQRDGKKALRPHRVM